LHQAGPNKPAYILLVTLEEKRGLHMLGRTEKKNMTETQP